MVTFWERPRERFLGRVSTEGETHMRLASDVKRISVSTLTLLLIFCVIPAFAQGPTIIVHDPVNTTNPDQDLQITAQIEGVQNLGNVVEARVRFRTPGFGSWDFELLDADLDNLVGMIPGESVTSQGLEYYIEADMDDGSVITYPAVGAESNPVVVMVRLGDEEAALESGVVIISPEPDQVAYDTELAIVVAFNPTVYTVDPNAIILRLNGKNITGKATMTGNVLVANVEDVENGRHRVDLLVRDGNQEKLLRSWTFEFESPLFDGSSAYQFAGSVGLDGRTQQYSGIQQNVLRELINVRMQKDDFRAHAYIRTTSEEQGHLQPNHRYRVTAGWPMFQVGLGDLSPKYNEMILYGSRVRGAELKFQAGEFSLKGIYGELRRGVDGVGYTIAGADTSVLVPGDTTFFNNYDYDPGTYRRNLTAFRLGFGDKQSKARWGFTVMKVRDDTGSVANERPSELEESIANALDVSQDITPKDNLVIGSDLSMNFDRRRVQFKLEAALSLYNSNISERPLEDVENLQNIIWVNQYFEPLPQEGLVDDEGNTDIKAGELASSILKNAFSWQTKLRLRYFGNDIRTGYKFYNRSFISLGNPSLLNDDAGFYFYDRLRIWDNRLYLNAGYRNFHNNVQGSSATTLGNSMFEFGFSVFTNPMYPNLNFNFRQHLNENDGEANELVYQSTVNGDIVDSTSVSDNRLSANTGTYGVGLTHRLTFQRTQNNLSLNYSISDRKDEYNEFCDSRLQFVGFNIATDYSEYLPLTSRLSFFNSGHKSMNDLNTTSYSILMLRVSYYMYNNALVLYANPKFTLGSNEYILTENDEMPVVEPPDPQPEPQDVQRSLTQDFTSFDWVLGFEWRFVKQHTLIGRASFTSYEETSEVIYFDGHLEANGNTGIDRNDYAFLFSYVYKF